MVKFIAKVSFYILFQQLSLFINIGTNFESIINKLTFYPFRKQEEQKIMLKEEQTNQEVKKFQPHFNVSKVKKIIQENQQIGKVSNLIPPLIQKSLQIFLADIITKSMQVAEQNNVARLSPYELKLALNSFKEYKFLEDVLEDVEQKPKEKTAKKELSLQGKKRSRKSLKENKQDDMNKGAKKGRKKRLVAQTEEQADKKQHSQ